MNPMVGNYPLSSEKRRPATQDAFKMHDMIEKPNLSRSGWRRMSEDDLASVFSIADRVHSSYPEDEAVFAERLRLYPEGCLVLDISGDIAAYVISHPWYYGEPPSLNSLLGKLPVAATTYYLHDLVVLPEARGRGAASAIVRHLAEHARSAGMTNVSLIAVNASAEFWNRHGCHAILDPSLDRILGSYGIGANVLVRHLCVSETKDNDRSEGR
jgi:GNAT superfamily N-acetyltransferase